MLGVCLFQWASSEDRETGPGEREELGSASQKPQIPEIHLAFFCSPRPSLQGDPSG